MSSNVVINQVLILFGIMIIGFLARKKNVMTATTTKDLTRLLLNVTCPLTIFTSFQLEYSRSMLYGAGQVFAFTIVVHLFALLIGLVIFNRYPEPVKRVLRFVTIFSNCGFMGFPLLQSVYGKSGVFYGSFYVIGFNLFIWTVGIRIYTGREGEFSWKKFWPTPTSLRSASASILFSIQLNFPSRPTPQWKWSAG